MLSLKQTAPGVQAGVRQASTAGLGHPVPWQKGPLAPVGWCGMDVGGSWMGGRGAWDKFVGGCVTPCHPVPSPLPVPRQRRWDRVGSWMGCVSAGRGGSRWVLPARPRFGRAVSPSACRNERGEQRARAVLTFLHLCRFQLKPPLIQSVALLVGGEEKQL